MKHNRKNTKALIKQWCDAKGYRITEIRHVFPLVLVVGYAAPRCIVIRRPWQAAEPQVQEMIQKHPLDLVHEFDDSLKEGDWACAAYVCADGWQQTVVVPWKDLA